MTIQKASDAEFESQRGERDTPASGSVPVECPESVGSTVWPLTMSGLLLDRWEQAWEAVDGLTRTGSFETMISRYTDPRRHYHTVNHLKECFDAFDFIDHRSERREEIELAIWFHDAFYDTKRNDNESRSAELAFLSLLKSGASEACAQRVRDLVMATSHHSTPSSVDADVLLDCDLWILAASRERFVEYEAQVRLEFGHVSDEQYLTGRMRVMKHFAQRQSEGLCLYRTPEFRLLYEQQAASNLAYSIAQLEAGILPPRRVVLDEGESAKWPPKSP